MTNRNRFNLQNNNTLGTILVLVLLFIGIFFVARGIFWLLSVLAPILIIAAAIIDYKVIVTYVKWLVGLTKKNPLLGIGAILLSLIGYPVVFAFLLGKALFNRRMKQMEQAADANKVGEFIDFEEVRQEKDKEVDKLDLPPLEPKEQKGDYDQFFKD